MEALNQKLAAEIKEREEVKEQLSASQRRFAGILEIANDAIISLDENQKIILFNQGAERIFGYQGEEVLGKSSGFAFARAAFSPQHQDHILKFTNAP